MTENEIRDVLLRRHADACTRLHHLVMSDPLLTNFDWPELRKARENQRDACVRLLAYNQLLVDISRP